MTDARAARDRRHDAESDARIFPLPSFVTTPVDDAGSRLDASSGFDAGESDRSEASAIEGVPSPDMRPPPSRPHRSTSGDVFSVMRCDASTSRIRPDSVAAGSRVERGAIRAPIRQVAQSNGRTTGRISLWTAKTSPGDTPFDSSIRRTSRVQASSSRYDQLAVRVTIAGSFPASRLHCATGQTTSVGCADDMDERGVKRQMERGFGRLCG